MYKRAYQEQPALGSFRTHIGSYCGRNFFFYTSLALLFSMTGSGAVIVAVASRVLGGLPQGGVDTGILATVQTVVLGVSALLLAWAGRSERFLEWGRLVYPVLAVTGLKVLFRDFPNSRPATLFFALAVYGGVLILTPRLRRSRGNREH